MLADSSGKWIDAVHTRRPTNVIVPGMDSSVSPTCGDQEGTAYSGHFGCTCYHPLFVFNQFGDLERGALRSRNVHSADNWRWVLEPVVARYGDRTKRRLFRGDAAFALPDLYDDLEAEGYTYTIRRKANAARLQLHALAYNLGTFLRTLALPKEMENWSLTTIREKVVKIGAKVLAHARYAVFQIAEVAVLRDQLRRILDLMDNLRPRVPAPC